MGRFGSVAQLRLFEEVPSSLGVEGTFRPNHEVLVHRWYPYLEGFSHNFVTALLEEFGSKGRPLTLYEPFAGSGTTPTVAAFRGDNCHYSEINPFMRLVVEAKTNAVRAGLPHRGLIQAYFGEITARSTVEQPSASEAARMFSEAFGDRPYFTQRRLVEVLAVHQAIANTSPPHPSFAQLARLALGSVAIASSELRRAGDLRSGRVRCRQGKIRPFRPRRY